MSQSLHDKIAERAKKFKRSYKMASVSMDDVKRPEDLAAAYALAAAAGTPSSDGWLETMLLLDEATQSLTVPTPETTLTIVEPSATPEQAVAAVNTPASSGIAGVDFSRMNSQTLGQNYKLTNLARHMCTSGPGTWLKEAYGYDVNNYGGWWNTPYSRNTTLAEFIKNDPTHWKLVYHSTGDKAGDFTGMQAGDVALSFANKGNGSATSHAAMYTGQDWRSDFIQNNAWVYGANAGRNGDLSYLVWRYVPDAQSAKEGGALKFQTGGRAYEMAHVTMPEARHQTWASADPTPETSGPTDEWDEIMSLLSSSTPGVAQPQSTALTQTPTSAVTTGQTDIPSYGVSQPIRKGNGSDRATRNNNPLNLRITKNQWEGKVTDNTDGSFEQFVDAAHGWRAGILNGMNKLTKSPGMTVEQFINIWSPKADKGNTSKGVDNYVAKVSLALGKKPSDRLDPQNQEEMIKLFGTMGQVEAGHDVNWDDVRAGWNLYTNRG